MVHADKRGGVNDVQCVGLLMRSVYRCAHLPHAVSEAEFTPKNYSSERIADQPLYVPSVNRTPAYTWLCSVYFILLRKSGKQGGFTGHGSSENLHKNGEKE